MKPLTAILMVIPVAALGAFCLLGILRTEFGPSAPSDAPPIVIENQKHTATAEMLAKAAAQEKQVAPSFRAEADDGRTYALADLAQAGPLALIFIKDGCPCSVAAGPYYGRLAESYGSRVRFFGVIDGDIEVARRWARANHVPFPILCDPGLRIVREYKAENSAYFAIIAPGGAIDRYWPGYSAEMLKEASAHLSRLASEEPKPIDLTDAPDDLYTGCPFDL